MLWGYMIELNGKYKLANINRGFMDPEVLSAGLIPLLLTVFVTNLSFQLIILNWW